MCGVMEVTKNLSLQKTGSKARGWLSSGLHPSDFSVYAQVKFAGYQTGFAGEPPIVNLRSGETLRRYTLPGLENGKTFAYWGANANANNIPGPFRPETWVNQPEKMYKATKTAGTAAGARYANAVYTYAMVVRCRRGSCDVLCVVCGAINDRVKRRLRQFRRREHGEGICWQKWCGSGQG